MLVALGNQRLFYYKLLKIRKITLTHKKNYLDDTFSRDYMGIRGKPQLLMRLQDGQVQWMFWWLFIFWPSGCFGLFFAFRRAFVLLQAKNKPKQPSGQKGKSHQNIHCTLSILQSQSIASAFDVSPYNLLKIYRLRNFSCASALFSYFLKFIVKIY